MQLQYLMLYIVKEVFYNVEDALMIRALVMAAIQIRNRKYTDKMTKCNALSNLQKYSTTLY